MLKLRAILLLVALGGTAVICRAAEDSEPWDIKADTPFVDFDLTNHIATASNNVVVTRGNAVLHADKVILNTDTGASSAEGQVRLERDQMIWVADRIDYNFNTHQMESGSFRAGSAPSFVGGASAYGDGSNHVYAATNAFVTTDDVAKPSLKVRAKRMTIVPGKYFEAYNAWLCIGDTPVFYFPYFRRNLEKDANHFFLTPGYRSRYGPFLLGQYDWILNDQLSGSLHLDWRELRGLGYGPDLNWKLGPWGDGAMRYYFTLDQQPGKDPSTGKRIDEDRQRFYFQHFAEVETNFTVKAVVRYQSDQWILRDFMESEYKQNVQPSTYFEADKLWNNWSLNLYAQPRINDFFDTVERLPDVKLTGFRQQLGVSPIFLESESSFGWFRQKFAATNLLAMPYSAWRGDTFQQLLWPQMYFGWLNVTPRAGGRLTAYGEAGESGGTTDQQNRFVFNTGVEVSFKASRLWPGAKSSLLEVDGLRHVIEPSINFVYIPTPNVRPKDLPQFDYNLPSFRLLPIDFPDFNNLDQIDGESTLRLGLRNRLTTKREGELDTLASWALYTDWRLSPRRGQSTFSDVYSDLLFKPRSWLVLSSINRYDTAHGVWRLAYHTLTIQPGNDWSWSLSHFYLRDGRELGQGNNLIVNTLHYRFNDNWGARMTHRFEARDGRLEEQFYTLYRDLRSWTTALTLRVQDPVKGPMDVAVVVTFSLKAAPRFKLGDDTFRPSYLLGG